MSGQATHVIQTSNPSPSTPLSQQSETKQIRTLDFANLTYSAEPIYGDQETFRLKDGVYEGRLLVPCGLIPSDCSDPVGLVAVAYGDATGDGIEEAMVVLTESTRGTAIPYFVYVFAIDKGQPKLLWAFATGDRAQGGLRKVFSDHGDLVVELYGDGARVDGEIYVDAPSGCCCPIAFTRTRYRWLDDHFASTGDCEVFPIDGAGDFEMEIQTRD
jgi:hypothetical protein